MGSDNYEKYRDFVRTKESGTPGGNYGIENQFGYIGAYQFGAQALQAQGLIKPGVVTDYSKLGAAGHKALLDNPDNWTIPGGKQAYLSNKQLQDQAFDRLSEQNFNVLSKKGVITPDTPPDQIAGYGAASHLLGAGAVANGKLTKTDANGTSGAAYFKGASKAVNGAATGVPPDRPTASSTVKSTVTPVPRKTYNGSDRALGETRIPNTVTIGAGNLIEDIPVPFPNPLSAFSSFNAVLTLSCITAEANRDPRNSYKAGDLGEIILRSAGAGTSSQSTAMTYRDNPSGQYDFYIDNLDINSIITFNQQTKGSNATDITFEVIEPYSMGVFLQSCEVAARKNGWPNGYLNAIFLLTIEFVGYDADGEPIIIPNTTRNIPITLKDIAMSVKHGGARYNVKGHPSNELPLDNNYRLFEVDLAVSGKTVQEILQSGEFSLQTVINKRLQEFAEKENVPTAFDEVVIVFPKVEEDDGTYSPPNDNGGSAVNLPASTITVSRETSASNLIQDTETLNEIGLSAMDFDGSTGGESQVNKQEDVQPDPKLPAIRNRVVYDSKTRQFIYSQGTSIINAISSVLINSKYCKDALDKNKVDQLGMVNWFRIETQVDYQTPKEGNIGNNNQPKLLIFKIVPYKVHSEKSTAPSAPVKGYDKLKNEAAKVYEYIYTGKNTEIINFEIEFKQAFFNTIAADQNKMNKQIVSNSQQSATTEGNTAAKTQDNTPVAKETLTGNARSGKNLKVDPNPGGTISEDHKTLIAKQFQRALNESETDLVTATLTIAGDPYFLADSGMGNFSNRGSGRFNVTESNAMDYQSGEVDIIINFRTPLDYDQDTGIMTFGDTEIVEQFSGLYKVNFVNHRFQRGKFTQELKLQRRKKQSAEPVSENEAADNYLAAGSEAIVDETGQVSNIRRNTETGELYDGSGLYDSGGRATANPKNTSETNKTTTVAANSATPAMTDAERAQQFPSDWMGP